MRSLRIRLAYWIAGPHRDYSRMWDELHNKFQAKRP